MNLKQNASLLVGLAISLILVIAIGLAIYIPRFNAQPPQHNFLYTSENYYGSSIYYTIHDNKLIREKNIQIDPVSGQPYREQFKGGEPVLYLHNVQTNQSREISFEEAEKFKLDPNRESPDGYSLRSGSNGGAFPFFYGGYNNSSWFLTGHNTSHPVNLKQITDYPNNQLLGWVIE